MIQKKKFVDLVLTYHWYDLIKTGKKRVEYRKNTKFWQKRLEGATHVRFRRGYNATATEFKIVKTDIGPCPYEGWDGKYIRIYFV